MGLQLVVRSILKFSPYRILYNAPKHSCTPTKLTWSAKSTSEKPRYTTSSSYSVQALIWFFISYSAWLHASQRNYMIQCDLRRIWKYEICDTFVVGILKFVCDGVYAREWGLQADM